MSAWPDGLACRWGFDRGDLLQHHGTSVQKEAQETLGEERRCVRFHSEMSSAGLYARCRTCSGLQLCELTLLRVTLCFRFSSASCWHFVEF